MDRWVRGSFRIPRASADFQAKLLLSNASSMEG